MGTQVHNLDIAILRNQLRYCEQALELGNPWGHFNDYISFVRGYQHLLSIDERDPCWIDYGDRMLQASYSDFEWMLSTSEGKEIGKRADNLWRVIFDVYEAVHKELIPLDKVIQRLGLEDTPELRTRICRSQQAEMLIFPKGLTSEEKERIFEERYDLIRTKKYEPQRVEFLEGLRQLYLDWIEFCENLE